MPGPSSSKPKKLLDQLRDAIRIKHYSYSTEKTYVHWAKRYILFHDKRHPAEMGALEIEAFLSHLAQEANVSASTQNQAFNALLFLYRMFCRLNWLRLLMPCAPGVPGTCQRYSLKLK